MQYGYFDDPQREYVITNPKTPVKWINYIGTLAFGGLVDHTGGLLLCKGDPALNRITKYIPQLPASDFRGATIYLRTPVAEGNGPRNNPYHIISPFFTPGLDKLDRYECHVGLGYTRIITEILGICTDVTIFVPADAQVEVRSVKITNLRKTPINLDAIPVIEYTHFDSLKQFTNADWVPQTMTSRLVELPDGHKVITQYAFMRRDFCVNYFTSTLPFSSFETDRAKFLGDHEYGTFRSPLALQQPELSNYQANRGDNIGALLIPLGEIGPGETVRFATLLGQETQAADALPMIQRFSDPAAIDAALEEMRHFWETYLGVMQVKTPDSAMNAMLNVHNPRQCHTTKNWSRYLSLYQLGLGGSRGIGTRDSSQDVLSVLASMPKEGLELIRKLLSVQLRAGNAMHQFNPLNMIGSMGDSAEMEDRPHYYSDDHLWLVLAVCAYVKETGDTAFLKEIIPFYEKAQNEAPLEAGTVLEHLRRALSFTKSDIGSHGLPLAGFADWNDTINLRTGAESLFTANLYGVALSEMISLCRYLGDEAYVAAYTADHTEMSARVNQHAWDGEWYVRYFDHDGSPIGSHVNEQGKIFLNSQTWAVLSGFATPERAQIALESVRKHLNTPKGIKLSAPGYNGFDPSKGGVTTYPPSTKENGGIFLHPNPWVMIAETMLGDGERAFEYYTQINPAAKNDILDEYEIEPYVYAQNILADEHPQFGLGRNSWLSGTSSWTYRAGTQYILGIRPDYSGLCVDPCIPAAWDGFSVTRKFRGATYQIAVKNPKHVCKGVANLTVDGKMMAGNIIPVFSDGLTHTIEVILG
ncbi:MAG: glycosyl transferase [Chloroflexi bacterium HGW-Chloroflexi-6]|nr:MAG: glycosyl transferase [Chloroflexi bacterium HGW-Chloroflexi-6]